MLPLPYPTLTCYPIDVIKLIRKLDNKCSRTLLLQFLLFLPTCLTYPFLLEVFPVHGSCPVSYQSLNRVTASLLPTTVLSPFSQLLVNSLKDSSTKTSSNISELITSSLPTIFYLWCSHHSHPWLVSYSWETKRYCSGLIWSDQGLW